MTVALLPSGPNVPSLGFWGMEHLPQERFLLASQVAAQQRQTYGVRNCAR